MECLDIPIELLNHVVYVVVGCDSETYEYIEDRFELEIEEDAPYVGGTWKHAPATEHYDLGICGVLIHLKEDQGASLIAHEAVHAALFIMGHIGEVIHTESELPAYITEMIVKKYLNWRKDLEQSDSTGNKKKS